MTDKPRITLLERGMLSDAPPELASLYDALLAQRGVVPNMFKTVAHTPALAMGFAALLKPLLSDGYLPGWYKELLATRVSVLLKSQYAIAAHSLSARQKGASEEQIAAARLNFEEGPFTDAQKIGFRCAERIHHSAAEIDDAFFAILKRAFTDQEIIELVATSCAFQFFPRFVDALRIPMTPPPAATR